MIDQIYTFFNIDMIYIWLNFGILPFWFILLFFPQSRICKIFVTSIFPILLLGFIDLYLISQIFKNGFNFFASFNLYLNLNTYYVSLVVSGLVGIIFYYFKSSLKKPSIYEKILTVLLGYFLMPLILAVPLYLSVYNLSFFEL